MHDDPPCESNHCLLCDDRVAGDAPRQTCPKCEAVYHEDCWAWGGERCQRLGCVVSAPESCTHARAPVLPVRIDAREIANKVQQMRRNVPVAASAPRLWRSLATAPVTGAVCGAAVGLLFRGICSAILWGTGDATFRTLLLIPKVYSATHYIVWWALSGTVYGILHRRHVRAQAGRLNHLVRRAVFIGLLGLLGYMLGRFVMVPAHRWGGHFAPFAWLPAWGGVASLAGLIAGAGAGHAQYIGKKSIFSLILGEVIGMSVAGVWGLLNGAWSGLSAGLFWGAVGFIANPVAHLFWSVDLRSLGYHWGAGVFGMVGFVGGVHGALKKGRR